MFGGKFEKHFDNGDFGIFIKKSKENKSFPTFIQDVSYSDKCLEPKGIFNQIISNFLVKELILLYRSFVLIYLKANILSSRPNKVKDKTTISPVFVQGNLT